jgi:hypothetical protein
MENKHFDTDPVLKPIREQLPRKHGVQKLKNDGFPGNGLFEKSTFWLKSLKISPNPQNTPRQTSTLKGSPAFLHASSRPMLFSFAAQVLPR